MGRGYLHLPFIALFSFSAMGEVDFQEKKNRVEFLEELSELAPAMNVAAYRRELSYEKQNIPLEKRAAIETNLLAEKIKTQIQKAYEVLLENNSPNEAQEEIKRAIEKDLLLVAPELRDELRELSLAALRNAQRGISEEEGDLLRLQSVILKSVSERSEFLNEEGKDHLMRVGPGVDVYNPSALKGIPKDSDKRNFISKPELMESLVSERESSRWVFTSNTTIRGDQMSRADSRLSVQLKVSFMGVELEAGPTVMFNRTFKTAAVVSGEGLRPVILADGSFDFDRRDREGNLVLTNGKVQKRFFNFTCEASLDFNSDYTGGGGFSVMGSGGGVSVTKSYSNSVSLASRRVAVPEFIDNRKVSLRELNEICHKDFLKANITNTMTVMDSLNIMMRNTLTSVRFSHPKMKCLSDNHCLKWAQTEILPQSRVGNVPRCTENASEKFRSCELRGQKGQSCPVFNPLGKLISAGRNEYACDAGLKCVTIQDAGIFKSAQGQCR
jgi:hypothetical protein